MYTYLPRGVARCHHIKINGTRCDSPALKGKAYCYFHYRSRLGDPAVSPTTSGQQPPTTLPNNQRLTANDPSPANDWSPLSPPADLFLLEDANSIQCALQWVLGRILSASIDRRQASLLLYGLQIATSNVKQTTFEPYYRKVIRDLPAESSQTTETNISPCHLEGAPAEPARGESKDLASPLPPSNPPAEPQPAPSLLTTTSPDPQTMAEGPEPTADSTINSSQAPATDHHPQATVSRKRRWRRPRAPLDLQMLSHSPRAALSLMFQREVRRHLAHLNFPASPETDPESDPAP